MEGILSSIGSIVVAIIIFMIVWKIFKVGVKFALMLAAFLILCGVASSWFLFW